MITNINEPKISVEKPQILPMYSPQISRKVAGFLLSKSGIFLFTLVIISAQIFALDINKPPPILKKKVLKIIPSEYPMSDVVPKNVLQEISPRIINPVVIDPIALLILNNGFKQSLRYPLLFWMIFGVILGIIIRPNVLLMLINVPPIKKESTCIQEKGLSKICEKTNKTRVVYNRI